MGDFIDALGHLNLTPLNTVLLGALGFFIRWAVKSIMGRLDEIDGPRGRLSAIDRRNQRQDLALARLEERLDMSPLTSSDDDRSHE